MHSGCAINRTVRACGRVCVHEYVCVCVCVCVRVCRVCARVRVCICSSPSRCCCRRCCLLLAGATPQHAGREFRAWVMRCCVCAYVRVHWDNRTRQRQ